MNKDITIDEFCQLYGACKEGIKWGRDNCPTGMMSEAFDKLSSATDPEVRSFWRWTWPRAFDKRTRVLIAVKLVHETPLADGRKVADLLTDQRSINALDDAAYAAYAAAAYAAAYAAYAAYAADAATYAAARAAYAAAYATADATADAATARATARAAQTKIVLSFGNPFKEYQS